MMKKFFSLTTGLLLCIGLFAQGGVNFQELTFDEALAKAKAENKLVFLDGYTSWCGPCKYMATEIFPQQEAGDFFNPRFVCVKFDMEKGEGKELAQKLDVKAFPSFFIIRPDGTVQHKIVGGGELKPFISRVERGLDKKTALYNLQQAYTKGKMSKKQLLAYKIALSEAYESEESAKIQQQLVEMLTEKDKLKKEFWPLFEGQGGMVGTDNFNFVLTHLPAFEKNLGKEKLDEYLYHSYIKALAAYIDGNGEKENVPLENLKKQIDQLNMPKKTDLMDKYALAEMVYSKETGKLLALIEPKVADLEEQELLNYISAFNTIYEHANKEESSRMAAVCEKAMNKSKEGELKNYYEQLVEFYRTKAHVGVYFQDLTLEQALEKAKEQDKMIFIDGYTSWCGPCKYMTNTIFPMEKVGDFMNQKFICVKYDMEKGEGPALAEKFGIRAFPTFVILNPDGTVRHKLVGGDDADPFIERVKEAFEDEKATGVLDAKYHEGNREKSFLVKYIKSLSSLYSPDAQKVAVELFGQLTEDEKVAEDYWFLFENNELSPLHAVTADYLQANRGRFKATIGEEKVEKCLFEMYRQKVYPVFFGDTTVTVGQLDQLKKEAAALKLKDGQTLEGTIQIAKAKIGNDLNRLLATCEREMQKMPAEQFPYFYLGYSVQEKCSPAQLNRWVRIGKKLIAKTQDKEYAAQLGEYVQMMEKGE